MSSSRPPLPPPGSPEARGLETAIGCMMFIGLFVLLFRFARWILRSALWLVSRGGPLGLLGIGVVVLTIIIGNATMGDEPSAAAGLTVWFFFLSGVGLWIYGALKKPSWGWKQR